MFTKSIDEKNIYIDQNGLEVLDIGESFMDVDGQTTSLYGIYKVPKDMEMRPDKVSISTYGSDEYTEMVCVFNNIKNPFTIEENDIVYMISLNNIYDNTYEPISEVVPSNKNNGYDVFRKFLDKSRLPKTVGSEKNKSAIGKSTTYNSTAARNILSTNNIIPPNIAEAGTSAIEITDGKIIYGTNTDNYIYGTTNSPAASSKKSTNGSSTYSKSPSRLLENPIVNSARVNTILSDNANNNLSSKSNTLNNALSSNASVNNIDNVINNLSSKIESILNGTNNTNTNNINSSNQNQLISDNTDLYDNNGNLINKDDLYDNNGNLIQDTNSININEANKNNIKSKKQLSSNVYLTNGKVSFDNNSNIGCAQDGLTASEYISKQIKNSIK